MSVDDRGGGRAEDYSAQHAHQFTATTSSPLGHRHRQTATTSWCQTARWWVSPLSLPSPWLPPSLSACWVWFSVLVLRLRSQLSSLYHVAVLTCNLPSPSICNSSLIHFKFISCVAAPFFSFFLLLPPVNTTPPPPHLFPLLIFSTISFLFAVHFSFILYFFGGIILPLVHLFVLFIAPVAE